VSIYSILDIFDNV